MLICCCEHLLYAVVAVFPGWEAVQPSGAGEEGRLTGRELLLSLFLKPESRRCQLSAYIFDSLAICTELGILHT